MKTKAFMHRAGESTPFESEGTISGLTRRLARPMITRAAGFAGLLLPVPLLGAAWFTVTMGPNLRENGFPWTAAAAGVLAAICTAGLTGLHGSRWGRSGQAAGLATVAAMLGIAGFFAALGTEDLLARQLGMRRYLSDNDVITGVGTLTASALTLIVVPLGLVILGIATLRTAVLDRTGRLATAALAPCLLGSAITAGASSSTIAPSAWIVLFGGCWFLLGRSLRRAAPHPHH